MYIDLNVKRIYSEHLYLRFGQTVRLFVCVCVCTCIMGFIMFDALDLFM